MNQESAVSFVENLVNRYDEFDAFRTKGDTVDLLYPRGTEVKESTAIAIMRSESKNTELEVEEINEIGEGVRVRFA